MTGFWRILWRIPVVAVALLIGIIGASQAGWSYTELFFNSSLMGTFEEFITGVLANVGLIAAVGVTFLVQKIAKPMLWVMVPILLYSAIILGAWNGVASDFDATRGEAIMHRYANAYALEHMSPRARFLSCQDDRIELTDDAKATCASALTTGRPGVAGSEHKCGLFGMFSCVNTVPEKPAWAKGLKEVRPPWATGPRVDTPPRAKGLKEGPTARSFGGYECTADCSGHKAGYEWAEAKDISDEENCEAILRRSPNRNSFYEGCLAYVEDPARGANEDDDGDEIE
jgi:hypothetical protein